MCSFCFLEFHVEVVVLNFEDTRQLIIFLVRLLDCIFKESASTCEGKNLSVLLSVCEVLALLDCVRDSLLRCTVPVGHAADFNSCHDASQGRLILLRFSNRNRTWYVFKDSVSLASMVP
jgi:hypothetical protein